MVFIKKKAYLAYRLPYVILRFLIFLLLNTSLSEPLIYEDIYQDNIAVKIKSNDVIPLYMSQMSQYHMVLNYHNKCMLL